MARHKPAAEGGYQRGEITRARIIEAAVIIFGERGYESASTRDIAAAAGVNAPAIQYYFDGKEGVYLECIEQLVGFLWQRMGAPVEAAEIALADPDIADQSLIEIILTILGAVVSMIDDEAIVWRQFVDRHQENLCPESASAVFETKFKTRVGHSIRALIARLTGLDVDDERAIIHSMALFTQGLAFRAQRTKLMTALQWTAINQREMELVRDVVLSQARFTLEGLARMKSGDSGRLNME